MIRRVIGILLFLMIVISYSACTSTPSVEFPRGTRVGIINLLESDLTHKNLSSFATENFTKIYPVNWDLPSYAENQVVSQLEKDANYTAVKLKVTEPNQKKTLRLSLIEQVLLSQSSPPALPPESASLLETISDSYNVQVVIVIGSYSGPSPYKAGVGDDRFELEGYGLFTRKLFSGKLGSVFGGLFSFRKAFAYAQIGVVVYKLQPVTYIAAARAIKKGQYRRPIEDFDWEADIKELPQAELNKARPMIQGSIDSAIKGALHNANLTP